MSGSLFALLWLLGGGAPWLFHLAAIAGHVAVTLGVLALLRRAIPAPWAAAGAALFAVMPVHVEAVANIVGSNETLVALGALGFVFAIWRGAAAGDGASALGWRTALLAAAAYALALGAKESGALIPAIGLALWWGWRIRPTGARISTLAAHPAWREGVDRQRDGARGLRRRAHRGHWRRGARGGRRRSAVARARLDDDGHLAHGGAVAHGAGGAAVPL